MIYDLLIALVWYLVFAGFGILALPVSMLIFRRMPDGGILLTRPLGWLLLGFFSWWMSYLHILPFSFWGIIIVSVALFGFSLQLLKKRSDWFQRKWRIHWRTALNGEFIAILAFMLILLASREDPGIGTTEKPMDIMMLNAMVTASYMPPPDPWLAGYPINYHYAGYLLHSIPIQLTGINPEIGYNMAFPIVAMLGVAIAFVLGRALFGCCRWAVLTPICIFFIGNLAGVLGFLERITLQSTLYDWRWHFMWDTTRVIKDAGGATINEYPFFTLLWGDLHPHFSNMPFVLFFMALTYAIGRAMLSLSAKRMYKYEWPLILVAVMACGFIFPTNVFDFPISSLFYGFATGGVFVYLLFNSGKRWKSVIPYAALLFLPIAGYILALPFWMHFIPPDQGTKLMVSADHTDLNEFLFVFGLHTAATIAFLLLRGRRMLQRTSVEEIGVIAGLFGIVFIALWSWFGYIVCALAPCMALVLWLLAFHAAMRRYDSDAKANFGPEMFALVACALSWSMIAGCEFVFLKDGYGIARMNTLFKFHFSTWFMMGMGLPYLLYHEYQRSDRTPYRWFVMLPVLGVFLLSLVTPVFTFAWLANIHTTNQYATLDGLDFLRRPNAQPHTAAIIDWIRDNTETTDRILEVPGCGYQVESAISAFTGRSTIVGWVGHEQLWRTGDIWEEVGSRKLEAERFYTTQNWNEAQEILKKHKINYVVYITPSCADKKSLLSRMNTGVFRNHLKPIIMETGLVSGRQGRFELYQVPEEIIN